MDRIGLEGNINPEIFPGDHHHHHQGHHGGHRRASHQTTSRYSGTGESDITSTAGYTLSGAHDRQQQQNMQQLSRELSPGKYKGRRTERRGN